MVLLLDNILGSAIKELRKSKKMTQQELSKLTGLKQNTISNHGILPVSKIIRI